MTSFYSTLLDNGEWTVPMNAGYPLNTTDDDVFFYPINQGYDGYISKELPGGFGKQDIYRIEIFSDEHPRKFIIKGIVNIADLISDMNDSVKISVMNIKKPGKLITDYSNPKSGEFELHLPQGDYQITYEADGAEKVVRNLNLPLQNPSDTILLPATILPKTDFIADLIVETNKTISVTNGDTILFPLKVEPRSSLTIEHWVGDSLVSAEHFKVLDSTFNYKMVPSPGNNRVVFKLTDRFNNTTQTEVLVIRENKTVKQPEISPEYNRIISQKQIESFSSVLKSRANDSLLKVISEANLENKKFGKIDDYISYLKEEAGKKGISTDEVDKLALKVALMDNILTQAAVDFLARNTEGELKNLLSDLDIYKMNLKTWTDLQEYIKNKSDGRISPDDLNRIANAILAGIDPSIAIIRNKILVFSENSSEGDLIRQSLTSCRPEQYQNKRKMAEGIL